MKDYKQRKERFFEELSDIQEIYDLLKKNFFNKIMNLKYDIENRVLQINEFRDNELSVLIVTEEDYEPDADGVIIASGLLDKYFEVDFEVMERKSAGYFKCSIKSARKAKTTRADLRFKINENDAVATNFRTSKQYIDVTTFNIPTSIKVILDQFATQNRSSYDVFDVGYFDTNDIILNNLKRSGKTIYIENLEDIDSYRSATDDLLDLHELLGSDELEKFIAKQKEKSYKSLIITPIMYITQSEQSVPFAYIKMISKTKFFTLEDVIDAKGETFKLVDRFRDANTVLIPARQQIVDISKGGLKLKIDNDDLKKYLIRAKGFVFDIVFKLQAPITIYGEIKFTGKDEQNNLVLGVSFAGNSSRKNEMKFLFSILKPMEINYKKKLIEELRRQQKSS